MKRPPIGNLLDSLGRPVETIATGSAEFHSVGLSVVRRITGPAQPILVRMQCSGDGVRHEEARSALVSTTLALHG